jgi:hypothetical protein
MRPIAEVIGKTYSQINLRAKKRSKQRQGFSGLDSGIDIRILSLLLRTFKQPVQGIWWNIGFQRNVIVGSIFQLGVTA